jgi:predicted homoserine dehydrogenase-like protein
VSVAKRDLNEGESLDGEGGYTVWGRLMPAADSLRCAGLPIGLAHGAKVTRRVARGSVITWNDVAAPDSEAVRVRREMESVFSGS